MRMAWTAENRRQDAPAIQEVLRQGMIVRAARTLGALDPQPMVGRERVRATLIVLQALRHLARDGCAWRRLPAVFPPFTTVWSRLRRVLSRSANPQPLQGFALRRRLWPGPTATSTWTNAAS